MAWILLGVFALLIGGVLAIFVTGAKVPGIKHFVDIEFIRWCLVVHVNLLTLVWFTALPMGLIYFSTQAKNNFAQWLSWIGFLISSVGVVLFFSVPPGKGVQAILSNYIPMINQGRYYFAIALFLFGLVLAILSPKTFNKELLQQKASQQGQWPGLAEIRFGLFIGSVFILFAILTMVLSFRQLIQLFPPDLRSEFRFFEIGMWGGGHLIQHASAVFLLCGWVILLSRHLRRPILTRQQLFGIFGFLGLPIFFVPIILYMDVTSLEFHQGFTLLMQWGIAPPILIFLFLAIRRLKFKSSDLRKYEIMAFVLSAILLVLGFIFGALIRGSDMRVPGHYHASIGAVTLTFMIICYVILEHLSSGLTSNLSPNLPRKSPSRWILPSIWTYGIGQSIFSGGMFAAGSFGMLRKTYGSEHIYTHWGQKLGIALMGTGGTVAMIGGVLFACAIIPLLSLLKRIRIKSHA